MSILVILGLVVWIYTLMRLKLRQHAKETFAQQKPPSYIWPRVPWKTTILGDPQRLQNKIVFSMHNNTLSREETEYHGNDFGMHFRTPVDITFEKARVDADRAGTIAFRISEWNAYGQAHGETLAEKRYTVRPGEQWIHLDLRLEGNPDKSYVIWYPKNEIDADVQLKRTVRTDNMYANARIGPVQFMGGASPSKEENPGRWYYLFELDIATPLYTLFDDQTYDMGKELALDREAQEEDDTDDERDNTSDDSPADTGPGQGTSSGGGKSQWIQNTDWPGGDIRRTMVDSSSQCAQQCRQNARCGAMAYKTDTGHCWLKDKNLISRISDPSNVKNNIDTRTIWVKNTSVM